MKIKVKDLGNGGVELAVGTTATVVGLHALQRVPQHAGWGLLGLGAVGYMLASAVDDNNGAGLRAAKTAAIVAASLGAVKALNVLGSEGGVPAITGFKGTINKIVPQLAPAGLSGLGNVEMLNEQLLSGMATEELGQFLNGVEETSIAIPSGQLVGVDSLM